MQGPPDRSEGALSVPAPPASPGEQDASRAGRPGPRLSVRALLILVALAALVSAAWRWAAWWQERRADYLRRAARHAALAADSRRLSQAMTAGRRSYESQARRYQALDADLAQGYRDAAALASSDAVRSDRRAAFHDRLVRAYVRAAARPWVEAPPDPPSPE